jgi:integrase
LIKKIQDRSSVDIAKRALRKIKQIYRYAVANGHLKLSPAAQIIPSDILVTVPVQNFACVDSRELPQLLKNIEVYCGNPLTRLAMKLMTHTFTWTTEMILAQWSEFDFDFRRWTILKTPRKGKKTPLIVTLAEQTIQILELIRQISGKSRLDAITPQTGAYYIMDRGYLDYARLYRVHMAGAFFCHPRQAQPRRQSDLLRASRQADRPPRRPLHCPQRR